MIRSSRRRRIITAVATMAIVAAASGETTARHAPSGADDAAASSLDGPVKVGTHWCLTGAASYAGSQLVKGTDLAVEEINETGFLGAGTIDVVNVDDASDPAQAVSAAQQLINRERVSAIVGGCTSSATLAALPIADDAGIPWVIGNAVGPGLASEGEHIFRTSMPYTSLFKQLVDEVFPTLGGTRVALVYGNDNQSQVSFADDFRRFMDEAGGYELVVDEGIRDADTDFSAIITRIANQDVDIMLPMLLGPQAANFVLQARRAGVDAAVVGQQGHNTPDIFEIAGDAAVGWILPSTWSIEDGNAQNVAFIELYRERHGEDPDLYAANGYTAMWVLAKAIRAADSGEPEAIFAALKEMREVEVPLGDGLLVFDENGEGSQSGVILVLQEDGAFGLWSPE